jgi:HEAT repeat protein
MRKMILGMVRLTVGFAIAAAIFVIPGCDGRVKEYANTLQHDQDAEKRGKAAVSLGEMGPAARNAVPALLDAVKDNGSYRGPGFLLWRSQLYVADDAAQALVKIGGPEAVAGLAKLLSNSDYQVAPRAAKALGEMGPQARAATPSLLAILDRSNQGQSLEALDVLEKIGIEPGTAEAQQAIPVLQKQFQNTPRTSVDHRLRAIRLFHRLAPDDRSPIPALIEVLSDNHGNRNEQVLAALKEFGAESVAPLVHAVKDREEPVCTGARWALSQYPPDQIIPLLQQLLTDANPTTRAAGAEALEGFGPKAAAAVVGLQPLLSDQDDLVRLEAAKALWAIDRQAQTCFPILVAGLQSENQAVRQEAEQALQQIGPKDKWAVEPLSAALQDKDQRVRFEAAKALWAIDRQTQSCFSILVAGLKSEDQAVRQEAEQALQRIGPKDEWAVEPLSAALQDKDQRARLQAAKALGQIGPAAKKSLPVLLAALADQDPDVRLAVARALAKVDPK